MLAKQGAGWLLTPVVLPYALWGHRRKLHSSLAQGSDENVFVAVLEDARVHTQTFRKQHWPRPTLIP